MKWPSTWDVIKDILLTLTGMGAIMSQVASPHPSDVVLAAGLALCVPSVGTHVRELLRKPGDGDTSPSSPPSPSSSSSPPPEDSGD